MPTLELEKLGVESLENSYTLSQIVGGASVGEQALVSLFGPTGGESFDGTATIQPGGRALISSPEGGTFPDSTLVPVGGDFYTDPKDNFFANTNGDPNIPLFFDDSGRRTPIFAPGFLR